MLASRACLPTMTTEMLAEVLSTNVVHNPLIIGDQLPADETQQHNQPASDAPTVPTHIVDNESSIATALTVFR